MKVGDLVRLKSDIERTGVVVRVDDSHRQTCVDVLLAEKIIMKIWEKHLILEEVDANEI